MSTVGKLLVGLQVVLSFVFLAMAGAVYTAHTNWKNTATTLKKQLADAQSKAQSDIGALEESKKALTEERDKEHDEGLKAKADLQNLQAEHAAVAKDKVDLTSQLNTQMGIAETKASEAGFRNEEAQKQRIINSDLEKRLEGVTQDLRTKMDELFAAKTELGDLQARYTAMMAQKGDLEKLLAKANINYDARQLAKLQAPPPTVDGLVTQVKKDRTNRPSMIVISIGADDGLIRGHKLDVYRSGLNGNRPQWLGVVEVVSTTPDEAVCEVKDNAKNGIIEVGDNVTTKLL